MDTRIRSEVRPPLPLSFWSIRWSGYADTRIRGYAVKLDLPSASVFEALDEESTRRRTRNEVEVATWVGSARCANRPLDKSFRKKYWNGCFVQTHVILRKLQPKWHSLFPSSVWADFEEELLKSTKHKSSMEEIYWGHPILSLWDLHQTLYSRGYPDSCT